MLRPYTRFEGGLTLVSGAEISGMLEVREVALHLRYNANDSHTIELRLNSDKLRGKEMAIRKKLTKVGNSHALLIDRSILDLLDITDKTSVEITMGPDGKCLIVRPVEADDKNRRIFEAVVKETKKHYGGAIKKLAKK